MKKKRAYVKAVAEDRKTPGRGEAREALDAGRGRG